MIKRLINKAFERFWDEAMDWLAEEPQPKELPDSEKIKILQTQVRTLEERVNKLDGNDKKHGRIWS